jgi:3-methyladenine DNA glycosylase AlkC
VPKQKVPLKDLLFSRTKVEGLASAIAAVHQAFDARAFSRDVLREFPKLELKARISWMAECLRVHLPAEYRRALRVILEALPPPNDPTLTDDDFGDFIHAPYAEFVARNGCTREHLQISLEALREITQRFSAEDAIRHFINAFPEETLATMRTWSRDPHYHVRRLASEGTRPTLPWSQRIGIPATAPIPILDNLFSDRARFVTRSVANHLNDISKVDPALAIATLTRWRRSGRQRADEMEFITRHALRTLVKRGDKRALGLLGFSHAARVTVSHLVAPARVKLNSALEFTFTLRASADATVVVDYVIHFRNKAGELKGEKVFKISQLKLAKGTPVRVVKRHPLRAKMTTRTLYPGRHLVEIQVNGRRLAKKAFRIV